MKCLFIFIHIYSLNLHLLIHIVNNPIFNYSSLNMSAMFRAVPKVIVIMCLYSTDTLWEKLHLCAVWWLTVS